MKKTYQTWEMVKMLTEYPKLKFQRTNMGEDGAYISVENNQVVWRGKHQSGEPLWVVLDNEWTLVQEPVTFTEATKAYSEGKAIKCEIKRMKFIYKKPKDNDWLCMEAIYGKEKGRGVSVEEILEGKWYIEE